MTSRITSCQANQLLALQRDLMETGLIVTVADSDQTTAAPRAARKTATAPRRGRPPKSATTTSITPAPKTTTKKRKMSKAGRKSVASASSAYHATIKGLRESEGLSMKQARARYKELKGTTV
jgi:hypothetical protein